MVLALMVWGVMLAEWQGANKRQWAGGALVGLACMMKMSPALLVLWWMVRKAWKPVFGAIAAAIISSVLVLPFVGLELLGLLFFLLCSCSFFVLLCQLPTTAASSLVSVSCVGWWLGRGGRGGPLGKAGGVQKARFSQMSSAKVAGRPADLVKWMARLRLKIVFLN